MVPRPVTVRPAATAGAALVLALGGAHAQRSDARPTQLQVEVGDSIGLPLPDAKIETFMLMEGGAFLEWVPVEPAELSDGVYLLRFSHPGYRTAILSVPLRKKARVSLRVRLVAEPDSAERSMAVASTTPVRAIGLFLEGHASTDIVRARRVLERDAVERAKAPSIGELLRITKQVGVIVTPGAGRDYAITALGMGATFRCDVPVMVNGDRRWLFPFRDINQRYEVDDVEAAEFIPTAAARPYLRRPEEASCGVLLLWARPR